MSQHVGKAGHIRIANGGPTMRQTVRGYVSEDDLSTSCASNLSDLKCTGAPPSLIVIDDEPLGRATG